LFVLPLQLALERFGSYFVEKLYHAVDVENKVIISTSSNTHYSFIVAPLLSRLLLLILACL
jgi:hypothetical protein